jgi:AraC-like DNA-binding protein/mannose-6-phosphate isomerase-like protein (cupin superfamily)
MHETSTQVRELKMGEGGEHPGFCVGDFMYHDGYSLGPGGAKGFSIGFRHRHPHFEIFWFRAGRGLIERDCDLIGVGPSTLLIIGPGDIHNWTATEHLEGSLLAVSERFTSESNFSLPFRELTAFLQPNGSRSIQLSPIEDKLISNVFEIIRDSETRSSFDQKEVLKALLLILFSKINGFHVGRSGKRATPPACALTRDFKQALLTECPRLASVKEFADHLRVSRSYLHRSVLRDTGMSPSDLIRDRIVFEAKRMLLHTSSTPSEIAEHLGFRSTSYFSSFFHRHTEVNPREFRSRWVG